MLLKNKKIKWGILAPGHIAKKFAHDLKAVKDATLYAVASRDLNRAEEFKEEFGAKKAYGNYMDLITDPKVDAIYIATPHTFHKTYTIDCLKNKKAVLCEKPLALNSADVALMIQTAKNEEVLLMEALWTYFLPHYQYVLNFLKEGHYGAVKSLEADFGFYPEFNASSRLFNKQLGGGSLLDIGIYPIFAALSILGVPDTINASCTYFETGADSSCDMVFGYKNRAEAKLSSTLLKKTNTEAVILCEKGTVHIQTQFHKPTSVVFTDANGNRKTKNFEVATHGYNYEAAHFNDLLHKGKTESPIMTFKFSQQLMETMDKVKEVIGLSYYE
ncbi:Gfo/Idh/MocA family protein [Galbibacter pacificus]|uniref:Gfo/Idh/MocA family oxidoreductase n=1 Tax=Galbibacter pacificus TaxID=2996052 RepID=A0ABT6FQX3_9FLAO|nr:Gfo/Idh/MocA family oxidoreductase [Galbibacter pacificus]MDG3581861.1 Gfo/Idh/MocA family oxidoreductase [Galbibacter pacificus]MDG3585665.1 Gfo/Idh/MocA family oxidoreductase [Galbibacter pacificus]